MAEDPSTWGRLEQVIDEAMDVAWTNRQNMVCGLSDVRLIADALREAGLVKEEE